MSRDEERIKADKFALIYEFNQNSPLFSRVAAKHLQNGEPEKALLILEAGLKKHPHYPTALILYSLTLAKLRDIKNAKEMIIRLSDNIYSEETVNYYSGKIKEIYESNEAVQFNWADEKETDIHTASIADGQHTDNEIKSENHGSVLTEDLAELANRLSNASIPVVNETDNAPPDIVEEDEPKFPGKSLVSETLAKIYFNQGNFNEALSIYETLLEIQPEKSGYYQKQISKIKDQLQS